MQKRKIYSFIILGLIAISIFAGIVSAVEWSDIGSFGKALRYLFGPLTQETQDQISAAIITIAIWLLIFFTFGDIISTFSTFSPWVSWVSAFLISVVSANLGMMTSIMAGITGVFSIFGITSVYIGLGGAFLAFVVVNLGIWSLKGWIMKRQAMMEVTKGKVGAEKTSGAIAGLKRIEAELEK